MREHWIKILIETNGDVNARDGTGQTLLHSCINFETTKYLIEKGADVNVKDDNNQTPLHRCNYPEIARLLIENGADVTAEDDDWNTPLDYLKLRCPRIEVAGILKAHMEDKEAEN